ncbi:MAG: addiction module toxin, HicA family [Ignavibacteria bacterium]|nr:addiction module toxin, HicA family [Ignavibacteria bacterium]
MARLPVLKGREIIAALRKIGYAQTRQRGSHIRLQCEGRKSVTVPTHRVGRGLLRKILRDADLTPEQFQRLLD